MRQLLFSDVDRTLLTHDYRIHPRVSEAMSRATRAGLRVVLATARSPIAVRSYARQLGIAGLCICFNGGWIGDVETGTAIESVTLDQADAVELMVRAHAIGANPMWYTADRVIAFEANAATIAETDKTGERLVVARDAKDLREPAHKIMCVINEVERQGIFSDIAAGAGPAIYAVRSGARLLEVVQKGTSKKTAAASVAAMQGYDQAECAAAGDAANDMAMLAWAARRITVENATSDVLGLADFIGGSCDEGGLADGIDWLLAQTAIGARRS